MLSRSFMLGFFGSCVADIGLAVFTPVPGLLSWLAVIGKGKGWKGQVSYS